ncbi:hypothetical protein J1N35_036307 [Gossypium stocksii]|uniref:Uncharacterized protein n=1 Tax=Gossypium stocksii TaxID=47602 RepID=A0A9D3UHY4_9ROSI|nr:hypothetical protein J1N35_036307 [Gossypium stocksii]
MPQTALVCMEAIFNNFIQVLVFNGWLDVLAYTVERINNYEVILCDPSTQEPKVLGIYTYLDRRQKSKSLFVYVESLVSINGMQEHEDYYL